MTPKGVCTRDSLALVQLPGGRPIASFTNARALDVLAIASRLGSLALCTPRPLFREDLLPSFRVFTHELFAIPDHLGPISHLLSIRLLFLTTHGLVLGHPFVVCLEFPTRSPLHRINQVGQNELTGNEVWPIDVFAIQN